MYAIGILMPETGAYKANNSNLELLVLYIESIKLTAFMVLHYFSPRVVEHAITEESSLEKHNDMFLHESTRLPHERNGFVFLRDIVLVNSNHR